MKLKVVFALLVFALLFTSYCYGQITDFNFLGGGARARAMGGAFFGVSDDPSAGSWNPAGLSQLDLPQMNATYYSGRVKVWHELGSVSREVKISNNLILSGALAIPFKAAGYDFVGSASYERLSVFSDESYYQGIGRSENTNGNVDAVTLSLGREVLKGFALGMAMNIYTGGYIYSAFQTDRNVNGDTSKFYHPTVKGGYSGFNMCFGTMFKVQNLSLGAVLKTPFTLKEEIDAKMEYDILFGTYVNPGTNRPEGVLYFSENKWKLPLVWGIGSAFRSRNMIIAADIEYRDLSKAELTYIDAYIPNLNLPRKTVRLNWEKGTQFRVGGEYIIPTKIGKIPLRAGYRNDPKAFTSMKDVVAEVDTALGSLVYTNAGTKGDKISGSVMSFGTGIGWNQIRLDVTYEYSKYDYTSSGTVIDIETGITSTYEDDITSKDNRLMVNFTGLF